VHFIKTIQLDITEAHFLSYLQVNHKTGDYLNINQLDALNFIMSLFHASTCFEHM